MFYLKSDENSYSKRKKIKFLIISTLFAYVMSLLLMFIFSILITYTNIAENFSLYFVKAATFVSVFFSGYTASGKVADKGWLSGSIAGAFYAVILIAISVFIGKNIFEFSDVIQLLICIFVGIAGGITGINTKKIQK